MGIFVQKGIRNKLKLKAGLFKDIVGLLYPELLDEKIFAVKMKINVGLKLRFEAGNGF